MNSFTMVPWSSGRMILPFIKYFTVGHAAFKWRTMKIFTIKDKTPQINVQFDYILWSLSPRDLLPKDIFQHLKEYGGHQQKKSAVKGQPIPFLHISIQYMNEIVFSESSKYKTKRLSLHDSSTLYQIWKFIGPLWSA